MASIDSIWSGSSQYKGHHILRRLRRNNPHLTFFINNYQSGEIEIHCLEGPSPLLRAEAMKEDRLYKIENEDFFPHRAKAK